MPQPGAKTYAADVTAIENATTKKPIGKITVTGTQALADATDVAIQFAAEVFDTHGFHDNSTNNTRVTPNVAGYYRFWGTVNFASQATPVQSYAFLRKNGSGGTAEGAADVVKGDSVAQNTATPCTIIAMNGTTDYVELVGRQDSAGADTTNASVQFSSFLEWEYMRPL